MDKITLFEDIIEWVEDNHMHHDGAERLEISISLEDESVGKPVEHPDTSKCEDGNYPYVNSLELVHYLNFKIKEIQHGRSKY